MIDKKELRSGNFVNVPHGDVQIDYLIKEGVHLVDGCGGTWQSLEPIPLSPEWLERFGFKKRQGWGGNEFYFLHAGYVEFQWEEGGFLISVEGQNLLLDHIKTVHQFQNIYYSLTSEELELKQ